MSHIEKVDSPPAHFHILDLFAGPGGLDVAADVLGYQVTGIEWDPGACATRSAAGMDTFQGDVRQYRAAFFPRAQVLTGGPPCQTFTVAGHGAGRRALDKVLEYIERLHAAVRPENQQDWRQIFRTWRKISEELRQRELDAKGIKAEKREVEELRAKIRKAMRNRLDQLGTSPDEVKKFVKQLKTPQKIDSTDRELGDLVKEFSDLNNKLGKLKIQLEELGDERTGLVLQPLWWVIERSRRPGCTPYEAVVLEQVQAVMPVWEKYAEVLASLGYRTRTQLMHTEAFGVPQTRRRAVLMARLDRTAFPGAGTGRLPTVPETHELYHRSSSSVPPSKTGQADTLPFKQPWVSMETALKKARQISRKVGDRPAFTVVSNYGTGGIPEARGRRDHDVPSATITGKVSRNRVVHKGTDKDLADFNRFNNAEAGVLQTFPVAYPWRGNDVAQQIGNAVPPRLALHVLRQVLEPGLSADGVEDRLDRAVVKLEKWKPGKPVELREHGGWEGHPLTGR
ncbi:DNA cytosine methyltransferase [Streptomyces sp. NBC_01288]|uniref:DNA cytosine methyltransferase n=1 Tax=Streptomyces sp. NBC_01288 TaxID=2903814 RepID=UPI002E1616E2|nr:DNA cytosine methyltransferase [Streptomyces sp. NBC_01288]